MAALHESPNTKLIENVLIEELKARYAEIGLLNTQIGSIYNLSITTLGVVATVIGVSRGGKDFNDFLKSDISRLSSSAIACVFLTLLILKNQYNLRISRQAGYISSVLRDHFLDLSHITSETFLSYETYARNSRAAFFRTNRRLKYLTYENSVIGFPFLITIGFSIIGAYDEGAYRELLLYMIIFVTGIIIWGSTGGFFAFLERSIVIHQGPELEGRTMSIEKFLLHLRKQPVVRAVIDSVAVDTRIRLAELKQPIYVQLTRSTEEFFSKSYKVEKEVSDKISELVKSSQFNTFFDIGANIGFYSFLVEELSPDIEVFAIEADRRNVSTILKSHKSRNSSACVILAAVSDINGKTDFLHDDVTGKTGSIVTVYGEKNFAENFFNQARRKSAVPSITLDSLAHLITNKTLIKVDIEGGEWKMLSGARNVIDTCRPTFIIEINRNTKVDVLDYFKAANYKCEPISKAGFLDRDYLATPEP